MVKAIYDIIFIILKDREDIHASISIYKLFIDFALFIEYSENQF